MKKNPKLICKNVWKLFGNNPKDFLLKHNNNPSDDLSLTSSEPGSNRIKVPKKDMKVIIINM